MFSIGEFSRIARVTARQLRHYEKLGLLEPERIDRFTAYRYYSARQLPRLNRILVLKDLGLSMDQIHRLLLENVSAEEIHGMLTMKKAQLEQTIRDELARILSIEERLHQIEDTGTFSDEDVVLKAIPAQYFLSIRQVIPNIVQGFGLIGELHQLLPQRVGKGALGKFAVIFHAVSFDTENIDVEMGFLTQQNIEPIAIPGGRTLTARAIPAVETMATMVCMGLAQHVSCYGALGDWIEKNNYQLAGPGWEVFVEPFQPGKEAEAVIEVRLPVIKAGYTLDFHTHSMVNP